MSIAHRFFVYSLLQLFIYNAIAQDITEEGRASYYAKKFQGRKTANGEQFSNYDYTAAHRTLPFNSYVNVTNLENKFNIIVRVNDRGPYARNRVIDLSEAAARRIGGYHHGLVKVKLEVLNIIQLTPEMESAFHSAPVVDCLGNASELSGITLSLWSTHDLLHAIYISNDLYIREPVDKILIGTKTIQDVKIYHVLVTGIPDKEVAAKIKEAYEHKGFIKVSVFKE